MVEMLSPLQKQCVPGRHGAAGEAGVILGTRGLRGLGQIAGWAGFEAAAAPVLKSLGLKTGGCYRTSEQVGDVTAWRITPDKILFEGAGDLSPHATDDLVTLDLSHARTVITLNGPAARDLLSQVIAIDVSGAAFGPDEFLQTGIHHVGVLIQCTGADSFDIIVPGTWAENLWEVLFENALPHGLSIAEAA